jgi:PPOX class probable FMN-dependent enzyme
MATNGSRPNVISTIAALEALYPEPVYPPARIKETTRITRAYRALIEASPFFALATIGSGGLDCSPRGDPKGFVRVVDDKTIIVPDRRGNNRIDSLRNLIHDPRVALLFLIPGVSETLRIVGRATISTDPALCESFTMQGKAPRSVLVIAVETVGPVDPGRACKPADVGGDPGRNQPRPGRRHGARPPGAGTPEGDDLLNSHAESCPSP